MPRTAKQDTASDSLTAQRDNLSARRAALVQRQVTAQDAFDAAKASRTDALAKDTASDIAAHTQSIRNAEDELAAAAESIAALDTQIASTDRHIAAANEAAERASAADTLNKVNAEVLAAASALGELTTKLGPAFAALVEAIPESLVVTRINDEPTDRRQLAAAILAEALARDVPDALQTKYERYGYESKLARVFDFAHWPRTSINRPEDYPALDASAAAWALIGQRLRHRASEILSGAKPANLMDLRTSTASVPVKVANPPADITLIAREDFHIEADDGTLERVCAYETHTLPDAVARSAIVTGLAYRLDDARAQKVREERRTQFRQDVRWVLRRQFGGEVHAMLESASRPPATIVQAAASR